MKKLKPFEYIFISAIITLGIAIDQITKFLASSFLPFGKEKPILDGLLSFTYITNDGAAWGMLDNARWVFMSVSTVAIIAMAIFLYGGLSQSRLYTVSVALMLSGGIGNMIDRIAYGYVVDFIDAAFMDFPKFNIADSLVCIGAGLLILALVLDIIKESKEQKKNANS